MSVRPVANDSVRKHVTKAVKRKWRKRLRKRRLKQTY